MWIQKTPGGKYQFFERYTIGKKKKVLSVTLDKNNNRTRKQAQDFLNQKAKAIRQKSDPDLITLQELADKYNEWKYETYKKQTAIGHAAKINKIVRMLGNPRVSEITPALYREKMSHEPPVTYNERLIKFKALIRWAYKNDLIKDIRFLDKIQRKKDRPTRIKVEDKYLERDELIALVNGMPRTWSLVTAFLALTGMRIAELIDLKKKNVDIESRVIKIDSTYALLTRESSTTKTETSEREIYIQNELLPVIREIQVLPNSTPYFISGTDNGRLSYDAYRKALKTYSFKIIGRKITPHVLRHTHTSLLAEQGFPLEKISRRLGHSDSRITRAVYLHITRKSLEAENYMLDSINLL